MIRASRLMTATAKTGVSNTALNVADCSAAATSAMCWAVMSVMVPTTKSPSSAWTTLADSRTQRWVPSRAFSR